MRYRLGISRYFLILGFGSIYFMSSICRPISLDLDPIYVLFYRITRKNLGDITFIMLKNKSCSEFLLEKEYLGEGTDAFNVKLIKFDR